MPSINPEHNFINPSTLSPAGRIGRQRFIATLLLLWLASFVIGFLFAAGSGSQDAAFLVGLIISIPGIFAYIKRCRDAGISPHWTWIILIPIAGLILFLYLCFKGSEPLPGSEA